MRLLNRKWPFKIWILFAFGLALISEVGWLVWSYLSAPMVSVVMSVYNGTKNNYLNRSIPSILNQSFKDFEFIIVDDGSTDGSWDVLKAYAAKDKRIKLIKNDKNRGISYSRNRGNGAARGKYIMIMDQDDNNHVHRILKQVAYLEEHPEVDLVAVPRGWSANHTWSEDLIKFSLFFNNTIGHPNIMVKRKFLIDHHIRYDESIKCSNDYDWLLQIRDNGGRFAYMKEPLFMYSGANYSATSQCPNETAKIRSRFSKADFKTEPLEYICDVVKLAQETPKYKGIFSPEYLDAIWQNICLNREK